MSPEDFEFEPLPPTPEPEVEPEKAEDVDPNDLSSCPHCGYLLYKPSNRICPECGGKFTMGDLRITSGQKRQRRKLAGTEWALTIGAGVALVVGIAANYSMWWVVSRYRPCYLTPFVVLTIVLVVYQRESGQLLHRTLFLFAALWWILAIFLFIIS
ncbi:MAG: hypothetical protein PVJ57_18770 [Phycisphaerae bacterium]